MEGGWQHISIPITIMMKYVEIVTKVIEKENTQNQRKLKIAISAISVSASRLMHLKMKAIDTINL